MAAAPALNERRAFRLTLALAAGCLFASAACMAGAQSVQQYRPRDASFSAQLSASSPVAPLASDSAIPAGLSPARIPTAIGSKAPLVDDAAVHERFDTALGQLSITGQVILRKGQIQWENMVAAACKAGREGAREETEKTGTRQGKTKMPQVGAQQAHVSMCRQRHNAQRLRDLKTAAIPIGPYMFSRIDYYSASPNRATPKHPYETHVAIPRIDNPSTGTAIQWNARIEKLVKADEANWCFKSPEFRGNEITDFEVVGASADLISVSSRHWELCRDAPHDEEESHNVNYLMKPALRKMRAEDFFRPNSGWREAIAAKATALLAKKVGTREGDDTPLDNGAVAQVAEDPDSWTVAPEGLRISFDPYSVMAYAYGGATIVIPWRELRRYLAPDAPIPQ